jgi:hypothetical protein
MCRNDRNVTFIDFTGFLNTSFRVMLSCQRCNKKEYFAVPSTLNIQTLFVFLRLPLVLILRQLGIYRQVGFLRLPFTNLNLPFIEILKFMCVIRSTVCVTLKKMCILFSFEIPDHNSKGNIGV